MQWLWLQWPRGEFNCGIAGVDGGFRRLAAALENGKRPVCPRIASLLESSGVIDAE
jgi:hypothetical protein